MLGGSALALCCLTAAIGAVQAAPGAIAKVDERIVVQVSDGDPASWNQALNVVRNLRAAYGPATQVEVVAFGNGIGMVKMDSEVGNRVGEAVAAGVPVYACENTMRGRKLSRDDMLDKVGYVPAGIVEIIDKQRAGWATVRP
jgi:hypothetical protein